MEQNTNAARLSAERMAKLENAIRKLIPSITEQEAATLSHDLSDLYDIAQSHKNRVTKILELKENNDRMELDNLLSDLFYGDIVEIEYHIASLKNVLPDILKRLDSKS